MQSVQAVLYGPRYVDRSHECSQTGSSPPVKGKHQEDQYKMGPWLF